MGNLVYGVLKYLFWISAGAVLVVTILPLINSYEWWIRMWDFPRLHILVVASILALISALVLRTLSYVPILILAACAAYQAKMIFPLTALASVEIELKMSSGRPTISLLATIVLMENEEHHRLIALIKDENPNVLFLMETNPRWAEALEGPLVGFKTVLRHPLKTTVG